MKVSSNTLTALVCLASLTTSASAFVVKTTPPPPSSATTTKTAFTTTSKAFLNNNDRRWNHDGYDTTTTTKTSHLLMSSTAEASTTDQKKAETYEFQAEVGRVMDIIINSLYSNRDVFLRELASNAADACDKKRFLSLTGGNGTGEAKSAGSPEIRIRADEDAKTVTIEDTGVGMTREELIQNLGRIAQSGTKKFLEALGDGSADVNLIGQFGVGFYSGYLVANKVTVVTKSMVQGSPQLRWESEAGSSFTIIEDDSEPIEESGTRIILHLKEDAHEYADAMKLEQLLEHYSEFVEFPIKVWKETTEYKKVPDVEANANLKEGEEPKMKTVPETTEGYTTLNTQKPIWLRSPKDVSEDEYKDFYKAAFRAPYDEPMKWTHFQLEGQVECKSVLYIPGMLPFELSRDMFDENAHNIRLYVKRVFINDKFDELMPRWLKFVKGVVDSNDLDLNVSREILQKTKVLGIINKRLVRKSLDMIRDIAEDKDDDNDNEDGTPVMASKYISFWNNFGKYLKVGIIEDERHKKDIMPFLRFFSSHSDGEEYTSLDEYVERMPPQQKKIYYLAGDGKQKVKMSPIIEKLKNKGFEVLYMIEPLDEICAQSLRKYNDYDIVDASKSGLDLEDEDDDKEASAAKKEEKKAKQEALNQSYQSVIDYLETELEGKVQKVQVSDLLTTSPGAIVQGEYGMSPSMQKYMKAQTVAMGDDSNMFGMNSNMNQAILEINPNHPIVSSLKSMVDSPAGKDDAQTKNFAILLYDVAAMTSGYEVENPADFAQRVMNLMQQGGNGVGGVSSSSDTSSETKEDDDDDDEPAKVAEVVG